MLSHGAVASLHFGDDLVDRVLKDWRSAPVGESLKAVLAYLEKLTLHPADVGPDDISALRRAGISDGAIVEAAVVCFIFSVMNRLADAFGFRSPSGPAKKSGARIIKLFGYRAAVSKPANE